MNAVVLAYHNMGITGLEALVRHGFEILTIFTHEDDPSENCWFESVKTWAQRRNISVSTTENIHSEEWVEKIRSFHQLGYLCQKE